jgi:hypothetical protein
MAKDLTVVLEDRPGTLAELGEALGEAGINIEAFCGLPCEGKGIVHILVEDAAGARRALEDADLKISSETEILLLEAEDRPGMLGEVARRMSNAGVNIELIYKATQTQLVVGVDDLEKGRAAVE